MDQAAQTQFLNTAWNQRHVKPVAGRGGRVIRLLHFGPHADPLPQFEGGLRRDRLVDEPPSLSESMPSVVTGKDLISTWPC